MKEYPRLFTSDSESFDPIELAKETQKIVTRRSPEGLERKYTGIYSAPVYGGIATGYASGCCLRCIYCWGNWSRDFPEKFGKFYSPSEVAQGLFKAAKEGITAHGWERFKYLKINKLRLSGCEPTIGKEHLLSVLENVMDSKYPLFILETNGILFGADENYVTQLKPFTEKLYVRVSFKAATPEGFTQRTGAIGDFYELPFKAFKYLLDSGIDARAAAMTDPNVMPPEEKKILIDKLSKIDPRIAENPLTLEEEVIDVYSTTTERLKAYSDSEFAKDFESKFE
ncbi:MAG: radical SAM protein [Candidatus Hodarchaeota archaeon]